MRAKRSLIFYLCIHLLAITTGAYASDRSMHVETANRSAVFRTAPDSSTFQMAVVPKANTEEPPPPREGGYVPAATTTSLSESAPSPHSFEVSPVAMRFEYEEPSYMSEKGYLAGVSGRYRFTRSAYMLEAGIELAGGSLDYDGSTWDDVPVSADSDDFLFELRGLFGRNIRLGSVVLTPFVGLGLRYWNDTIQAPGGYEREITYLYSPVGLKFSGPIASGWSWSMSGEYDFFWQGWVISHLSDVNPWYNDPENNQDTASGYGYRVSLELRNRISQKFAWYIQPFFRYWDVGKSDYAVLENYPSPGEYTYVYEPANHTTSYGASIGFVF